MAAGLKGSSGEFKLPRRRAPEGVTRIVKRLAET
jgi:hypothetical protein